MYKNYNWTLKEIAYYYARENPSWTKEKCNSKASIIYKELNRMNRNLKYNNNKYYNKFLPLSLFEDERGEYCFYDTDKNEDDYYRYK